MPTNALDRLNRKYGLNLGGVARAPSQLDLLGGVPSEEEEESIIREVGRSLMGGLQFVGETLDKPGRALRGVLAGRPGELANLIPFSDTIGLTDPTNSTSGRDLLEQLGVLSANTPGLDIGDVAGFGAEVLLDPLIAVAGPAKGVSAAAKAGGKYLTRHTPEVIKAVEEGATGLLNLGVPGVPFVSEYKPLVSIGKGPKAAERLAAAHYGRASPLNWMRGVLGSETHGIYDPVLQRGAEEKAVATIRQNAATAAQLVEKMPVYRKLAKSLDDQMKERGIVEADRQNLIANQIRQELEKAGVKPDQPMYRSFLSASGKRMGAKVLDFGAAVMHGLGLGLANVTGKTAAEEIFSRFPHIDVRGLSGQMGIGWTKHAANKSQMPVGVKLDVDHDLWSVGFGPGSQVGGVEETYVPLLHDASPTWSEVVPREHIRKPLPSEEATNAAGQRFVLAEPLPARFRAPFITRHGDSKFRLFRDGADTQPQVFDQLLDAQNAAAVLMEPDPIARYNRLADVGSELPKEGLQSLKTMGDRAESLMRAFGKQPGKTLENLANELFNYLPDGANSHIEAISKAYGSNILASSPARQAAAKDFANFMLTGQLGPRTDMDVPFSAMGHVVANIWQQAGKLDDVRNAVGKATADLFDKTFLPANEAPFLKGVEASRAAWLANEAHHTGLLDQLRGLDSQRFDEMIDYGLNVPFLQDSLIGHWARRWTGDTPKGEVGRRRNELFGWMQLARNNTLRNLPGGTSALRRMSLDRYVAGIGEMSAEERLLHGGAENLDAAAGYLTRTYGVGEQQSKDLAQFLGSLNRKQVEDRIPIFNRDAMTDVADYLRTSDRMLAAVKSLHQMIPAIAERTGGTVPLRETWAAMGLTEQGLAKLQQATGIDPDKLLDAKLSEQMTRFVNSHTRSGEIHPLVGAWDAMHRSFKSLLTTPFPAKHARDLMSSMFESWTAGAMSPAAINDMWTILRGKLDEPALADGKVALRTLLDEMIQQRTLKKYGSSAAELLDFSSQMLKPGKSLTGQALEDLRSAWGGARSGWRGALGAINPFSDFRLDRTDEAVQAKQKFLPAAAGQAFGDLQDMLVRGSHYIALRRKGYSPLAAHESVTTHLHDWQELNRFEKDYARRGLTFYSWVRKNLPYQLEQLLNAPGGKTAQAVRAVTNLQKEGEADGGWIPNYIRQRGGIPLGPDEAGVMAYITGQPLAVGDLNTFVVPSNGDAAKPALRRTAQNLLSMLNPLLALPVEQFTGEQLWSGRPLKYLHGMTGSSTVDQLLWHSPIARGLTTARRLTDDRKSIAAKLVNLASGFQVSQISPEDIPKWQMVDLLDAARAVAKDNPHLKDFERVYVEAEDIQHLSPETMRLLAAQLVKTQEHRAAKQQQAEGKLRMK